MQTQQPRPGRTSSQLDGGGFDQHVQRRLGRAIGIPATQPIITNAADFGREQGHGALRIQQRQEIAQQQRRPQRIDLKNRLQGVCIQC